jgi:hypothetical protein
MPYIRKEERSRYNKSISEITKLLLDKFPGDNGKHYQKGDLNYVISSIIWNLFDVLPSYARGDDLVGTLECVKLEFTRRKLNPYEDLKIKENGDL